MVKKSLSVQVPLVLVHQGRHTESELPDGAPGDTAGGTRVPAVFPAYTGITEPLGANAELGMRKANCPSVAGTI